MYRIIDGRGTGKTSRLMLLAKENNGIIVCANPAIMREKAFVYGITGIDFISYEKYLYGEEKNYDITRPIFIDELDQMLKIFDSQIAGYSLSEN